MDIEWKPRTKQYSTGEDGYLGKVLLWSITWRGTRGREDPNKYSLRCMLPGVKSDVPVPDAEAGKARAQRQLDSWLGWTGLDK